MTARKPLSVVVTGDVDSGKSTLVGRLLHDTGSLRAGAIDDVERYCRRWGRPFEYAYLLDSFEEERQGEFTLHATQATIRVADQCELVLIDVPGHQELVVDMLSGASYADAAVLVIDADRGVREQTRRHAFLIELLGLSRVVVAVNKLDLHEEGAARFHDIDGFVRNALGDVGVTPSAVIPISAKQGVNLLALGPRFPWHSGGALLEALTQPLDAAPAAPFRFVTQGVQQLAGRPVAVGGAVSGSVRVRDRVTVLPQGVTCTLRAIRDALTDVDAVSAPRGIGLELDGFVPARGDVVAAEPLPTVCSEVDARLFFVRPAALGQTFVLRCATQERRARISQVRRLWDCGTLHPREQLGHAASSDVADVVLTVDAPFVVERRDASSAVGRVMLEAEGEICAMGMVS